VGLLLICAFTSTQGLWHWATILHSITQFGPVDLLGYVEPIGRYEELLKNAEVMTFDDVQLKVIGLDDLIRIKQHVNRPKDRDSLMHLLAIQRIRDEQASHG
jgi:predicted nucleotidyltransferase